jgi:hypothetical protein
VLDIIGIVQFINGKKSLSLKPLPVFSSDIAYYNLNSGIMQLESKGNVAAIQFKIKVRNQESGIRSRELGVKTNELKRLKIFSLKQGFEFAYGIVDNEVIGILYSLIGKKIPEGISELLRFEGINVNNLEVTEIFGGDLNGDYVPVLKKGESNSVLANEAKLEVNPNPFSYSTQINYLITENALVSLRVFDLQGGKVETLVNSYLQTGEHSTNWNGTNDKGQRLKPGIYILQLSVRYVSGNNYNKELKVVLINSTYETGFK